ncbi:MAG TPA: type II secretion system F family protein [Burkholderiales bacterium]|nr:type II secretion system F family protein [Burkholderiales bacterium]
MPGFRYHAVDADGRRIKGRLEAANESDLERRLRAMDLELVDFAHAKSNRTRSRVARRDMIALCFELEQISRAGLPLIEGVRDLRDACPNPKLREVLTAMLEDIEGGRMLSQAMEAFPREFSPVFVSLIRAGEQSGRLTEVLENLVKSLRWEDELRAHTRKLMIYPAVVAAVVCLVVAFLLVYLVPQVVTLLKNMGVALPLQTRLLIAASDALVRYGWLCLVVLCAFAGLSMLALKRDERARAVLDRLKLRLPLVGPILQKIILARFASFFALMYRSGITVLDALRSGEGIVGNKIVADGLARAGEHISAGQRLSEAFAGTGLFPPLVIRMTRVGENTGALDHALLNVNYLYEREVREGIEQALKLLEPMMTLLLGGILALILFSVLAPLYEVVGNVKF